MKRANLFLILVLIVGSIGALIWVFNRKVADSNVINEPQKQQNLSEKRGEIEYYYDFDSNLRIVKFPKTMNLGLVDNSGFASSLKTYSSKVNQLKVVLNAGYFVGNANEARHAGLLQIGTNRVVNIAPNDKQLTHFLTYASSGEMSFFPISEFSEDKVKGIEFAFQTGPLLLDKGQVQSTLIKNSLNGEGKYKRTAIGFTESGNLFFAITNDNYSLEEFALKIKENELMKNEVVSLLNLDGGSSTALLSKEVEKMNYNINKILPFILTLQ